MKTLIKYYQWYKNQSFLLRLVTIDNWKLIIFAILLYGLMFILTHTIDPNS